MIALVSTHLALSGANIGNFRLYRPHKGFQAIMTIELDGGVKKPVVDSLRALPDVISVVYMRVN